MNFQVKVVSPEEYDAFIASQRGGGGAAAVSGPATSPTTPAVQPAVLPAGSPS
jgi:heme/copper-type cytochrome/quinol oxidase subunit 2